jgi:hypothetical protein
MRKGLRNKLIAWGIVVVFFLLYNEYENHETQAIRQQINSKANTPGPNPNNPNKPLFYSIQLGDWVYATPAGAKASGNANEPYSSSDDYIEKYLQKHIPAYKKKTYWGEEIDIPDIHWDDEGDDHEGDPDHRIK